MSLSTEQELHKQIVQHLPEQDAVLNGYSTDKKQKIFKMWKILFSYLYALVDKETEVPATFEEFKRQLAEINETGEIIESSLQLTLLGKDRLAKELMAISSSEDLDSYFNRFLKARKGEVDAAVYAILKNLAFRHTHQITQKLMVEGTAGICPAILDSNLAFFWNADKTGHLVTWMFAKRYRRSQMSLEEMKRSIMFNTEVGKRLVTPGTNKITIVCDLQGAGFESFDLSLLRFVFDYLQNHMPETLNCALMLNAPIVFWGFWKLIKPAIDPETASKIHFVSQADLTNFIEPKRIISLYGGEDEYFYDHFDWVKCEGSVHPEAQSLLTPENEERRALLARSFIQETLQVSEYLSVSESSDLLADDEYLTRVQKRSQTKYSLHRATRLYDDCRYPPSIYHHIGAIAKDGTPDWDFDRSILAGLIEEKLEKKLAQNQQQ